MKRKEELSGKTLRLQHSSEKLPPDLTSDPKSCPGKEPCGGQHYTLGVYQWLEASWGGE